MKTSLYSVKGTFVLHEVEMKTDSLKATDCGFHPLAKRHFIGYRLFSTGKEPLAATGLSTGKEPLIATGFSTGKEPLLGLQPCPLARSQV